jgi:hypothetical protein
MKTALALAAILGLSVSAASACGHKDRTASVDTDMTVASIQTGSISAPAEPVVVKDKK